MRKQLLHDRIADQLRSSIKADWKPGQRLESEAALAKSANVSIVTLRNAMLILEREGLIERSPGRGTFVSAPRPASSAPCPLPSAQSHIAIFCGGEVFSPRPSFYYLGAVSALRRFFTEQNLVSQVYFNHREIENRQVAGPLADAGDNCPELTQAIADRRISAAAFLSGTVDCTWSQALRAQGVPVAGSYGFDVSVTSDWAAMGRQGARQLASRGCKRLALVCWAGEDRLPMATRNDVVGSFCNEIQELGLHVNEAWIRHDLPAEAQGAGWEEFREIWNSGSEKPDGLLVTDDLMFADVVHAVTELGIDIPNDLRIVSHANRGASYPVPFPVDWLEYDSTEHGRTLGNLLLQRLRGETIAKPMVTLQYRLVESSSDTRVDSEANPAWANTANVI